MRKGCIDIESSGLLEDMLDYTSFPYKLKPDAKLWCVVITDVHTREYEVAVKEQITKEWLKEALSKYDVLVAHNGIRFDFITLFLFGVLEYTIGYLGQSDTVFEKEVRIDDSLILSRLSNPDRIGGHSLKSWGIRTGDYKSGFRQTCIDEGLITKDAPAGAEFKQYTPSMVPYCVQDTMSNISAYLEILKEYQKYDGWRFAIRQEHKLADLAVRRENLGFFFDRDLALHCLDDLTEKMERLTNIVNPKLPERPLNKGELDGFTPGEKQVKKDGQYTQSFLNFVERVGGEIVDGKLKFEGKVFDIPVLEPLKTTTPATIGDLDAVKMHLIDLGWKPSEWKERDLTKDSKKQNLTLDKRIKALDRWYGETIGGKYKDQRLEFLDIKEHMLYDRLRKRLNDNRPVRVPTSPSVRVGVEKEICPNLISLGEKVDFAKDFADYLTYRHRKSSIAGGDIEDMDFDTENPNTGYLSMYREEDGRVATPAIEIGASTCRYRHIGIANIPRATSVYGKEMRSLFGCGEGFVQLGYDFASLEARIEGHYIFGGTDGEALAATLLAEKPLDLHTITGLKLGIPRSDAKSINYAVLYGAQVAKLMKMLACSKERAEEIFEGFWNAVPALKELKEVMEKEWLANGKKFVRGIDGRKITIRSQHSILNALFQSAGVICAKYTLVFMMQELEAAGYCIDVFKGKPDVGEMISYHDEAQLAVNPALIEYKTFEDEDSAKAFVENWEGLQLSAISEGKKWYVALPNAVSIAIDKSIEKVGEFMELNVPLGFEWIVNKNWYGCH